MRKDVIVINRDDASRACAKAVQEMVNNLNEPEDHAEFYAMKMLELAVFSAIVVSKLFEDEEKDHE